METFFTCLYMNTFQSNFKLSFRPDSVPTPSAIIVTQALPHYGEEINLESQYVTLAAFIKNCIIPAGLWPWGKTKSKSGNENQMGSKLTFQQNSEKIPSRADTKVKWQRALGKVRFWTFQNCFTTAYVPFSLHPFSLRLLTKMSLNRKQIVGPSSCRKQTRFR